MSTLFYFNICYILPPPLFLFTCIPCIFYTSAQSAIWHYNVHVKPNNECLLNGYTFASLPEAISFYTENRLGSVFLKMPVSIKAHKLLT